MLLKLYLSVIMQILKLIREYDIRNGQMDIQTDRKALPFKSKFVAKSHRQRGQWTVYYTSPQKL